MTEINKKEINKISIEEKKQEFVQKYGEENIKILLLPLDEYGKEELEVIVRVPDRKTISNYILFIDKNIEKANDILIANCLLTEKETVMKNDDLYFACANGIAGLIKIRDAKIKK